MKKQVKKLELAKETVRSLGVNDYRQVVGGEEQSGSWYFFCLPTPSKFC